MRLSGKRIVVTGAGAGIGRAIAMRFAREGAHIVVSDIATAAGEAVANAIRQAGGTAHFVAADARREADVRHLITDAVAKLGGVQCLVNNAGIELIKRVVELTEEDWDAVMDVNVKGVFFGCKHAIPAILEAGGGCIINVASAAGLIGFPLLSAYCASKGAVIQFTKAMTQEYKDQPIRFNALCPMLVATDLGQRFIDRYQNDYGIPVLEVLQGRQGRLATVDEVADAAVFLASDESGFINGHALVLDHGALAG